jgi:hypothetical protein
MAAWMPSGGVCRGCEQLHPSRRRKKSGIHQVIHRFSPDKSLALHDLITFCEELYFSVAAGFVALIP